MNSRAVLLLAAISVSILGLVLILFHSPRAPLLPVALAPSQSAGPIAPPASASDSMPARQTPLAEAGQTVLHDSVSSIPASAHPQPAAPAPGQPAQFADSGANPNREWMIASFRRHFVNDLYNQKAQSNSSDSPMAAQKTATAQPAPALAAAQAAPDVHVPGAFVPSAMSGSDPDRDQKVAGIQQDFVQALQGQSQNPSDPSYLKAWNAALFTADERLRGLIGNDAFNRVENEATRMAGSISNGTLNQ